MKFNMQVKLLPVFIVFILAMPLKPFAQVSISDSLALVDFYDSTGGPNWNPNYNTYWKTSAPVSWWPGVSVRNNRVVGMYMTGNHLTGRIPASFASLDSMKGITFIDNGFRGDFLPYISNFKDINFIHIGEYFLPGPIPSSWGSLSKLTGIILYGPSLSGPIPSSLGNLANLKNLDLGNSMHSGEIPLELSNLDLGMFLIAGNLYTFKELEPFVRAFTANNPVGYVDYSYQANIPTLQHNDELVVAAGGTPRNNTYNWYKSGTGLVATFNGDSSFKPTSPGTYYASVTNSVATQLTLTSIPIKAASVVVAVCPSSSVTITSDVSGSTYQWQESVDSVNFYNIANNANYAGTTSPSLQLLNVPSSWRGHKYRCIANGLNSTIFTIYFPNKWISTGTTNWEDTGNWSCSSLPDANTDVIINVGTVVLNSNVSVRSLTLADGVTFTVSPGYRLIIKH